jgi:SP family general alpha glucoside:H+ symporter-like MFS transporter
MEAYCVFLMGNFIALPAFEMEYGIPLNHPDPERPWGKVIAASWQSALQMGGPVGAIIGVCLAGPLTSRIGYRWATITGLMLLNAFIFVFYFANSLPIMFVSQLLEGIPWGIFIANAPAYCSEITPIQLRAPATQMLQMFWAIGAIIVNGVAYYYNPKRDPSAYRYVVFSRVHREFSNRKLGFLLRFNGCSQPLSRSSSFWLQSLPGGSCERDVSQRLKRLSDVSDARVS